MTPRPSSKKKKIGERSRSSHQLDRGFGQVVVKTQDGAWEERLHHRLREVAAEIALKEAEELGFVGFPARMAKKETRKA